MTFYVKNTWINRAIILDTNPKVMNEPVQSKYRTNRFEGYC